MIIKNLKAKDYRNLSEIDFTPGENVNIIYGENAQGKTNLIEAIWLFTGEKSFRGSHDEELVKKESKKAFLSLDFISGGVEKNAALSIEKRRVASLNGNKLKSAGELSGNMCAVIFSPDDLGIVSGSPKERRRFLDSALAQYYPNYINRMKEYTRAVAHRNYVLKQIKNGEGDESLLDGFEEIIAETSIILLRLRLKYLECLRPHLSRIYYGISGGRENLVISYTSTFLECNIRELLLKNRRNDMLLGATSVGIHRDDLQFFLNNIDAKKFASQGQKRSIALALKLAEAQVLKDKNYEYPVILLDDVLSELDNERQKYILNKIDGLQIFITCCNKEQTKGFKNGKIFCMDSGELK